MIRLTAPDGTEARVDGARVIRIRSSYPSEANDTARTRIDWVGLLFVREEAVAVAQQVSGEHPNLARLTLPNGDAVWFDAKRADGPIRLLPGEKDASTKSAILLAGKKQFVSNTPAEVSAAIAAAGGTPLPLPADGLLATLSGYLAKMKDSVSPIERWE